MKDDSGKVTGGEGLDEKIVAPEMTLISLPERGISIEKELAELEKNIEFFNKVKVVALKLTKPQDWLDQGGTPYLMDRGAENIAIAFGVDVSGLGLRMEWAEDEKGRYYSFIATGKAYAKKLGRYIEDIGVCSQRDKFFGVVNGQFKEIAEVDMANIRRKAVTNLYSRLIKRVIGLMGVTFADLTLAGIDPAAIVKVEYKTGAQKAGQVTGLSEEGKTMKQKLEAMLLLMANKDKAVATKLLEKYSYWETFEEKNGQKVKVPHFASDISRMSEKWLAKTFEKAKADFDKTAGGPPATAAPAGREPGEEG